ncbi:hypothetical protein [Rhodoplanes serenus]|uniref:hypothetical protein n=1 Tax=Rhodoplanes serenus TaxID=200615 RepID=UPI000DAD6A31|nr:hypothetical protein [Rhodoplanes serenus]RAI33227.1 hypothetical protein CH340_12960 [Rhodoplanes serenus]
MCGIFGFVVAPQAKFDRRSLLPITRELYLLSESRGKEAAGLAVVYPDRIEVLKAPVRGRALIGSPQFGAMLDGAVNGWRFEAPDPIVLFGHTRMVTNGSASDHGNNQPVIKDGLVCIHNGIVVNDEELWRNHPHLVREAEVDTEALLAIVAERRAGNHALSEAVATVFGEARGANSIALAGVQDDALVLATANGSLFFAASRDETTLVFTSERYFLERMLDRAELRHPMRGAETIQIRPGEGFVVPFEAPRPLPFALDRGPRHQRLPYAVLPPDRPSAAKRRIVDHEVASELPRPHVSSYGFAELEAAMTIDFDRIDALRRCTRCLLPETFPFIVFDEEGVCQHCRNHRALRRRSEAELRFLLEPIRRTDGKPDCLVPFSGGRDSSYGLHYVKTVLGLNPVAYTYDWGMVTDLARRNISRMCEALEVEHILVAADIRQKREFIRLNVSAWLKRPHLGMVPLFMAGDKQFFYYAKMLLQQMDLPTVMFSQNRLERTDFKVGFCGIDDTKRQDKVHGISTFSKLRMGLFYAKEFALNPAYINRSILDTIGGFYSFYLLPFSFNQLYDFVPWDETEIERTLLGSYDWETATDTRSTWRIGDGTAPFYNYVYLRMAGLSEFDTFRSHQVREGMLTRDDAVALNRAERAPRPESFKWYCDAIGIDPVAAAKAISKAPTRYA